MKLKPSDILAKITPIVETIKIHRVVIFIVFFLGLYGFLITRINSLINSEPPQTVVSDKTETIKRIKVDQKSIDSLLELEEQNIEVKTLFQQARDNPFTE
jgi:hypothetical protein